MGGRYIGAYFFIPLELRPEHDDELFHKLGAERLTGEFGPMSIAERQIDVLSDHVCVQLYFLASELINVQTRVWEEPLTLERDPSVPFAELLRAGAVAAGASVLIVETHDAILDKILERYWMILVSEATALAIERFGLLYMCDEIVEGWVPHGPFMDRDELHGGPGRTLFGGRGRTRWYW